MDKKELIVPDLRFSVAGEEYEVIKVENGNATVKILWDGRTFNYGVDALAHIDWRVVDET